MRISRWILAWTLTPFALVLAGNSEGHDGNLAVAEHARPLIPEHEMNSLRAGMTEEELLAALPEWNEAVDGTANRRVEGAEWPTSRLYEINAVVTVYARREPTRSDALAGYGLIVSRHGSVLRIRTETGARAEYRITDDTGQVLEESADGLTSELVPATRAIRMTGARPEQVILTEAALSIVTLGFNTMDVTVTHAARIGRSESLIMSVTQSDPGLPGE